MRTDVDPVTASDSHTYEQEVLIDWFHMYQSSPVLGLPMTQTIHRNHILQKQIKEWTTARSQGSIIPSKRSLEDTLPSPHDLAFRAIDSEAPPETSQINRSDCGDYFAVEGRCLIKLYRSSRRRPDSCYWVSTDTDSRVISILFRYWAWSETSLPADATSASQLEVRVPDPNPQDNLTRFYRIKTSDRLADVIRHYGRSGWVEADPLFGDSTGNGMSSQLMDKLTSKVIHGKRSVR